ncbi:MAG: leucine-rich repeat protein, partial [Ruminococcus sp.]|nr:leucine-rich repeat protein [Ruminococcus sp.]
MPDKVETVCYGAFENCNSITSIIVPKTLTEINNMAFSGCRSLINIWVDAANPVTIFHCYPPY